MASTFRPREGFMRERLRTAFWPSRYTSFLRERELPGAVRGLAAVGRELVLVRMPTDKISSGSDRDDDARPGVVGEAPADKLGHGLGSGPPQLREQLPPAAE
jgi:hypothetical protein